MRFSFIAITFFALSCLIVTGSTPVFAASKKYSQDMRFVIPDNPGDSGAQDVRMQRIMPNQLPPSLFASVRRTLQACITEQVKPTELYYFSYYSKWNKDKKLPANFIIDYSPLAKKKLTYKKCHNPLPPCSEEGCSLEGYVFYPLQEWERSFAFTAKSWGMGQYKKQKKGPVLTYFKILKTSQPAIEKQTKKPADHWNPYLWNGSGMNLISQE